MSFGTIISSNFTSEALWSWEKMSKAFAKQFPTIEFPRQRTIGDCVRKILPVIRGKKILDGSSVITFKVDSSTRGHGRNSWLISTHTTNEQEGTFNQNEIAMIECTKKEVSVEVADIPMPKFVSTFLNQIESLVENERDMLDVVRIKQLFTNFLVYLKAVRVGRSTHFLPAHMVNELEQVKKFRKIILDCALVDIVPINVSIYSLDDSTETIEGISESIEFFLNKDLYEIHKYLIELAKLTRPDNTREDRDAITNILTNLTNKIYDVRANITILKEEIFPDIEMPDFGVTVYDDCTIEIDDVPAYAKKCGVL